MSIPANPSAETIRRNPHLFCQANLTRVPETERQGTANAPERPGLRIVIVGQCMGGKNNIGITRTGRRYPKAAWARWRDDAVAQVRRQLPESSGQRNDWRPISVPTKIRLDYYAGDWRRRDMPAIVDALFHVLEKAGFVKDDCLLWIVESQRSYDKANPRMEVTILAEIDKGGL